MFCIGGSFVSVRINGIYRFTCITIINAFTYFRQKSIIVGFLWIRFKEKERMKITIRVHDSYKLTALVIKSFNQYNYWYSDNRMSSRRLQMNYKFVIYTSWKIWLFSVSFLHLFLLVLSFQSRSFWSGLSVSLRTIMANSSTVDIYTALWIEPIFLSIQFNGWLLKLIITEHIETTLLCKMLTIFLN